MTHQYQISNVIDINYFTIFLQTITIVNLYWFSFGPITNIIFSITNNHSPRQQLIKRKKIVALAFFISN